MKNVERFRSSFVLAGVLCLMLVGCGGDSEESTGSDGPSQTSSDDSASGSGDSSQGAVADGNDNPAGAGDTVSPGRGDQEAGSEAGNASSGTPGSETPTDGSETQPVADTGTTSKPMTAEQQVMAAVDDAVKRLEAGDVHGFLDHYLPIENLREIRNRSSLETVVAMLNRGGRESETLDRQLALLKRAQGQKPEFNPGYYLATIELKPEDPGEEEAGPKYVEPEVTDAALNGFGDDLNVVFQKAIASLKDNDVKTFVANLFPAGELRHPDAEKKLVMLESRVKASPKMVEQMIADLEALSELTPKLEKDGAEAVYVLKGRERTLDPGQRNQFPYPDRTIRLQKVEGSWRFYDNTTAIRKTIATQLTQPPVGNALGAESDHEIKLERFGDRWRLARMAE